MKIRVGAFCNRLKQFSFLTFDIRFRTCILRIVIVLQTTTSILQKCFSCSTSQRTSLQKCFFLFLVFRDELRYFITGTFTFAPVFIAFVFPFKTVQHRAHLKMRQHYYLHSNRNDVLNIVENIIEPMHTCSAVL